MKNSKSIEESLIGINKAKYFGYLTPVQQHIVIRGKPIAIYMHNSLNSCALLAETALKTRGKWKVPPSILSFPLV